MFKAPDEDLVSGGFSAPAEDLEGDVTTPTPQTGLERAVGIAETINKPFKWVGDKISDMTEKSGIMNNPSFTTSIPGLGLRAQGAVSSLFEKGGEKMGEWMAEKGANPYLSATVGTGVKMAPDIGMTVLSMPGGGPKPIFQPVRSKLRDFAEEQAMKAAGATPSMFAASELPRTRQIGRLLKDKGVVGPLNSTESMFTRLKNQMSTENESIGSVLEDLSASGLKGSSGKQIADRIRSVKFTPEGIGAEVEGTIFETAKGQLEKAAKTAELFGDKPMPFKQMRELKGLLQNAANYDSEARALMIPKKAAGAARKEMEANVESASSILGKPELYDKFKTANKNYSLLSDAEDFISSQAGKEKGRSAFPLGDIAVGGAGGIFGGGPGAVTGYVAKKLYDKFGNQLAAYGADSLAPFAEKIAKYTQILKPASQAGRGALIEAHENLLRTDPEFAQLIDHLGKRRRVGAKPLFRKAG